MRWRVLIPSGPKAVDDLANRIGGGELMGEFIGNHLGF